MRVRRGWRRSLRRHRAQVRGFDRLSVTEQLELIALHGIERTRWDIFHGEMAALGMPRALLATMPGHGWPSNYVPFWKSNLTEAG